VGASDLSFFRRGELGEAEVQYLHPPIPGEEQVLGLQVAMHDPLLVSSLEAHRDLNRVVEHLAQGKSPRAQPRPKRFTLEKLSDEVRRALVGTHVVDRENVRMIEHSRSAGLLEPSEPLRIRGKGRGKDFDRDHAPEPRVPGTIDFAPPAPSFPMS
jgi:hypothetical protein